MRGQEYGTPYSVTGSTGTQTTISRTGTTGRVIYVTEISASGDGAGVQVTLKQGSTTLLQDLISTGTSNATYFRTFSTPLAGALGATMTLVVGTANSITTANLIGYELQQ